MRVLRPGQRVRLTDGDGYDSDAVIGTIESAHLYQDGSIAYSVTWWDDRRRASATLFPNALEPMDDPEWLEVCPVVNP